MEDSFYATCRDLDRNDPCLTMVNLNCACMGNDGCRLLAQSLQNNTRVVVLFLNQNRLQGTSQAWYNLCQVLARHPTLEHLYLSHNPNLQDHGVTLLAQALSKAAKKKQSRLRVLKLTHCQIGNNGCRALSWWLGDGGTRVSLQTLDLQHNHIGNPGATALARSLAKNDSLTILDLRFNAMEAPMCHRQDEGGSSSGSGTTTCWWQSLAKSLEQEGGNTRLRKLEVDKHVRRPARYRPDGSSNNNNNNSASVSCLHYCCRGQHAAQLLLILNQWGRSSFGDPRIPPSLWAQRILGRVSETTKSTAALASSGSSLLYHLVRARPDLLVPPPRAVAAIPAEQTTPPPPETRSCKKMCLRCF